MPNKKTYGEELFERYLKSQKIAFDYEPSIEGKTALIDYVVEHPSHGRILIDVKDICNTLPARRAQAYDPYEPIRQHIEAGKDKFRQFADELCVLVMVAGPSSFVDLDQAHVMLGAMYGNVAWTIPFDPNTGKADISLTTREFVIGEGLMLRGASNRNTRIAAIVSLQKYSTVANDVAVYIKTDDGRSEFERKVDVLTGLIDFNEETVPYVTVWENAAAKRKLPSDLFRGEMDAWWTANEDGRPELTFVGTRRQSLGIDDK